ncbi:hypothetical protein C8T65DRAFT_745647 [Cerioporus squamosus]|nr:hypothetical protein C8T65DRAFT_745647 [Cerioporus squamosus]
MSGSDGAEYSMSVFGVVVGAIGTFTVIPMIWSVIQSQLPPAKFKKLEQTLLDTETLLRSIIEEGLQLREMRHFEGNLNKFRSSTERVREETYRATTFWEQVDAWFDGLSSRIGVLCKQIQEVRASICESSAEARAQLSGGEEVVTPVCRGLLARLGRGLRHTFAFVLRKTATIDVAELAAPTGKLGGCSDSAVPACAQAVPPNDALRTVSSMSAQSNADPGRTTSGTAPGKKRMQRVLHAIGRLEQEMTARRVRNAALRKIMQAAKRQRSTPGVAQSSHSRRSRKPRSLRIPSGTAAHLVVLSQTCDFEDESDVESWEDELVVPGKDHSFA